MFDNVIDTDAIKLTILILFTLQNSQVAESQKNKFRFIMSLGWEEIRTRFLLYTIVDCELKTVYPEILAVTTVYLLLSYFVRS